MLMCGEIHYLFWVKLSQNDVIYTFLKALTFTRKYWNRWHVVEEIVGSHLKKKVFAQK